MWGSVYAISSTESFLSEYLFQQSLLYLEIVYTILFVFILFERARQTEKGKETDLPSGAWNTCKSQA